MGFSIWDLKRKRWRPKSTVLSTRSSSIPGKAAAIWFWATVGRALRDKLFHEVGFTDFYNFAYRGGTVPEMIDTYRYALERTEDLKGIVIGVPLRSMDEKFSGAKNQVPEAIDIKRNPLRYFGSLFVADTGAAVLEANHPGRMRSVKAAFEKIGGAFSITNSATASETITDECEQLCRSSNFMKDDDFIDFKGIRILAANDRRSRRRRYGSESGKTEGDRHSAAATPENSAAARRSDHIRGLEFLRDLKRRSNAAARDASRTP